MASTEAEGGVRRYVRLRFGPKREVCAVAVQQLVERPISHAGWDPLPAPRFRPVPPRRATVRRRRIVIALTALTAIATVAALGSGGAAWWAVVGTLALGGAYLAGLHHVRRLATERGFEQLADPFTGLLDDPVGTTPTPTPIPPEPVTATVTRDRTVWGIVRFSCAYAAGWAIAPVVFCLTLLVRETPRDTTSQRWLVNLQAAQERLREQSLHTIAVSAATTASVTAVGTMAAFGAPAMASAAPIAASVSVPVSASLEAAALNTYVVEQGDTLWGLANRFGTTVAALVATNHLSDPNLIYPGQTLIVGSGSAATTTGREADGSGTYRVVAGDTLGAIAARFGTTVSVLAATNNIANPNLIYVGQVLVIRGGSPSGSVQSDPSSTAAASSPRPSSAGQVAAEVALQQVGKPYVWAGAGPNDFDCSGLVMYAWEHAGVDLPHYTVSQYDDTARISEGDLEPGDLVFYDTGDGAQPGHVTIYIGGGEVVTADQPGTDVRVVPLTWDGTPMAFGRVS